MKHCMHVNTVCGGFMHACSSLPLASFSLVHLCKVMPKGRLGGFSEAALHLVHRHIHAHLSCMLGSSGVGGIRQ